MAAQKKKTLLLVEDEPIIALVEAKSLEKYGYSVIIVHNGEKAVETVNSTATIDLVLMDIDLGKGIDGTQAAEIILKNHDLPLVFLSSHKEPEIVNQTEGITSYGYVLKHSGGESDRNTERRSLKVLTPPGHPGRLRVRPPLPYL